MLRSNRLAVRLVRWLTIAQIGSVVIGMAAWMLLSPYVTFRDVAADRARVELNPVELVDAVLGPRASENTRAAIQFAGSRPQALAVLLMSPEFQWR